MGKSKKTRWRALPLENGSQDDTLTNDVDVKFNENTTNLTGSTAVANNNKFSQILGDHHNTNNSTFLNGKNPLSNSFSSYKSRSYNNKENYYNQRSGVGRSNGGQKSWQRSGSYRAATLSYVKDSNKKQEENIEKAGSNDSSTEPKRFNEDEYTRITTPRQDVLFKKGYLSRNINKTATTNTSLNTASTTANSTANSSATTSDPDSSVNSLSPATTPSMEQYGSGIQDSEYGQQPYFYPGYGYDESGMFVIPMYNGYYQSPVSPGSPMIFMPYSPYPYDPIFMPPNDLPPTDVETEEKEEENETTIEVEGEKKESSANDENDENRNSASTSSPVTSSSPLSLDGDKCSNNQEDDGEGGDEAEEEDEDEKKKCENQLTNNVFEETATQDHVENDELNKQQEYPFYQNYGNYIYPNPNFPNNYFNPYYFFNGHPQRPPKMKRRKRFPSSRNQSRSTETTTDDENTTQNKFNYKYQSNGWSNAHPRSYFRDDQNHQNHASFTLNVNVEEFHPRNQMQSNQQTTTTTMKVDETKSKVSQENSKVVKTSQPNVKNTKVTKREIIQGIKSMEQQNIDLMATKHTLMTNANQDDEWNVIKKGKKVKVVRENEAEKKTIVIQDVKNDVNIETKNNDESTTKSSNIMSIQQSHENNMKKTTSSKVTATVVKKTKNKGKKKKPNLMLKQDGFEIIEPEFTKPSFISSTDAIHKNEEEDDDEEQETSNDESAEVIHDENLVLRNNDKSDECIKKEIAVEKSESVVAIAAIDTTDIVNIDSNNCFSTNMNVNDLTKAQDIKVDTLIDISDDDIRSSKALITEILKIPNNEEDSYEEEVKDIVEKKHIEKIETIYKMKNIVSPEVQVEIKPKLVEDSITTTATAAVDSFQDNDFFNDRSNIADLERDLIENLRQYDEDIEFKSPIINPLYDFPITSAVQKWLQAKQNESFDSLFHVQNLKKLCEIYNDVNDDDEDDETESEISEKEMKSETDSDYASDFHAKTNGNSPTCSNHAKSSRTCNKLIASKESFCALM